MKRKIELDAQQIMTAQKFMIVILLICDLTEEPSKNMKSLFKIAKKETKLHLDSDREHCYLLQSIQNLF